MAVSLVTFIRMWSDVLHALSPHAERLFSTCGVTFSARDTREEVKRANSRLPYIHTLVRYKCMVLKIIVELFSLHSDLRKNGNHIHDHLMGRAGLLVMWLAGQTRPQGLSQEGRGQTTWLY